MRAAKAATYRTLSIYVALGNRELHIERVRLRVSHGGHDIPGTDIRRRYGRTLLHAPEAVRLADETVVLDNSGPRPESVVMLKRGQTIWRAVSVPSWVRQLALPVA